jgi:hypothetical protein
MFRSSLAGILTLSLAVASLAMAPREASARRRVCAPPPIEVTLCVDDPCDCCAPQMVCVCVPCCCTEAPCVTWRNGFLGRRVATYEWKCCGHCVEVVVTRRGDLIVRD